MIKKPEFSQWWFHTLSERLRSKHRYLNKEIYKHYKTPPIFKTWGQCIGRNCIKTNRLYKDQRMYHLRKNTPWDYCIAWQKKKITRLNDPLEFWRKREALLLKRMNENNFKRNEAPNILWNFKVYKQISKLKKLILKTHKRSTPQLYNWGHVTKRIRYRLPRKYSETYYPPITLWSLNIKANKLKINTTHLRSDWINNIFKNIEKLKYRIHKHPKKNNEGYSQLQFK